MAGLFCVQSLSFAYAGKPVLSGIDFQLEKGCLYGVVGPNGSGKTTLLDLLAGIRQPQQGSIRFLDRPVGDWPRRELAKRLALVPQEFSVNFDFTVHELVLMGRHPHIPRFADPTARDLEIVTRAMREMEVESFADRYITELSGGEKQRVIVARALAQDTDTLLLDEATASLDVQHAIKILSTVRKRAVEQKRTVIAAIHDLNFAAAFCDSLLLLAHGRLDAFGPPEQVLTGETIGRVFNLAARPYVDSLSGAYQIAYDYGVNK